jgi:hypothetical protein
VDPLSNEKLEELGELFKSPAWSAYLDILEVAMLDSFKQIIALEPTKAESFMQFVELKGRIDQIRDITYFYQRELAANPEETMAVDNRYDSWFKSLFKKVFKRS